MSRRDDYNKEQVSLEQALRIVESGNRVVLGHTAGEPLSLSKELVRQRERLSGVEIVQMVATDRDEYCDPGMVQHFTVRSLFVGASSRKAVADGRTDLAPVFFSDIPGLFKEDVLPVEIAHPDFREGLTVNAQKIGLR